MGLLDGTERPFRLLVEQVTEYAIFLLDPRGCVRSWNAGAERLKGYTAEEILGRSFATFFPPEDLAEEMPARLLHDAATLGRARDEGWRVRKDGTRFWADVVITALHDDAGRLLGFAKITRDLTERREAQQALARAKELAEAASRAKSDFLATTSHEIRTPLNAVIGYTELVELGIPGPLTEQQRTFLERVRLSSRHLLGIVNQVLDLSRIEAGKARVRRRVAGAGETAETAAALVEPQAAGRSVRFSHACTPGAQVAYVGDSDLVSQILVNLLSNAVKFTPPGGAVTLSCGTTRTAPPGVRGAASPGDADAAASYGWTYFRVEDTGVGIPADKLQAIFEPFEQVEAVHTRLHGGTGLGLPISQRLARLMGGDVTVRSRVLEGSTFFLWLPGADPATEEAARTPAVRERRGPARHARGLSVVAEAVRDELERVLSGYTARLRADAALPQAAALSEADLEDHAATFIADLAQCLTAVEVAAGAPSTLVRDSTAIQRLIAERHGAQRARLGWDEPMVRRDYQILRDELAAAVRRRMAREQDVDVGHALALCSRFVDHAEASSLRVLRTRTTPAP